MDLSPEEKRKIYDVEKARIEAQERAKKELSGKKWQKGCLGCLGTIAIIIFFAIVIPILSSDKDKKPSLSQQSAVTGPGEVTKPYPSVYVKKNVNIRRGPGTNHPVVRNASEGERLQYISREGDWYKLKVQEGKAEEWVHRSFVITEQEKIRHANDKLSLLEWSWHIEYGYAIVEGRVKNVSILNIKNVQAVVVFYTKDGRFITSSSALIEYNPILPGQISPFKVMQTYNPDMYKASIDFKTLFGGSVEWYKK